jgi:hypothetical protein
LRLNTGIGCRPAYRIYHQLNGFKRQAGVILALFNNANTH